MMAHQLPPLTISSSDGPYSAPRPDSLIEHAHRTDATRATRIAQLLIDDIAEDHTAPSRHPPRDFGMQPDQHLPPIDPGDMNSMSTSEMSLREHLLAAQAGLAGHRIDAAHGSHPGSPHDHLRHLDSSSPQAHHIGPPGTIDPAISGSGYGMAHVDHASMLDDELGPDGKRGSKRELSTSKRAAQNRAAQRAFRQRKEGYIKKLEEENRHMKAVMDDSYSALQGENYQLRDVVLTLQSRLGEFVPQSDIPQPQGVQLRDTRTGEPLHHQIPSLQQQSPAGPAPPISSSDLEGQYRPDRSQQQHSSQSSADQQPLSSSAVRELQAAAAAAASATSSNGSEYPQYPSQLTPHAPLQQNPERKGYDVTGRIGGEEDRAAANNGPS